MPSLSLTRASVRSFARYARAGRSLFALPLVVAAVAASLFLFQSRAMAQEKDERYFEVQMGGVAAGYSRVSQETVDGKVTSSGDIVFKLKRGPIEIGLEMRSTFVETTDGKPLSMKLFQKLGSEPVESDHVFEGDLVRVISRQGGREVKSERPAKLGKWLPPAAAQRLVAEKLTAGEKSVTVATIDPLGSGEVETVTHTIVGDETISVRGKSLNVKRAKVTSTAAPGVESIEFLDANFEPVKSETRLGGLVLTMIAAGPEVVGKKAGEAPEMMVATFVKPDRPIEDARRVRKATYSLSVGEGEMPELPSDGPQRVAGAADGSLRVTVDADALAAARPEDVANAAYLGSSAMIDLGDPLIRRIAQRATARAGESKSERAEALRRQVYRHISKKGLDVGFATASEVAKNRAGDCTEHGVLLAAVLRADGIPSRVVAGLIYADQFAGSRDIFGYHMWAQALLEVNGAKRWVDLDATLPDDTPFDATHIALGVSALGDDQPHGAMVSLASMLGRLRIKVESAQVRAGE